jgi:hypothetical protein
MIVKQPIRTHRFNYVLIQFHTITQHLRSVLASIYSLGAKTVVTPTSGGYALDGRPHRWRLLQAFRFPRRFGGRIIPRRIWTLAKTSPKGAVIVDEQVNRAEVGRNPNERYVADIEATERAVDTLTKQLGKLDILFANAGFHELTPIGQTSVAQFEKIIRPNLTGVFFTIQAVAPHLNEGASIILLGIPGFTAYAAAKGGIRTMTRNLASEFAPRKI